MEFFQGNIDMISNDNSKYIFTDGENIYELAIDMTDDAIEFVLAIEGRIQKFKATFSQAELFKFTLFKVVDSLDNVLQIIDVCLKNKEVKLTYQKCYVMTFFSLYFKTTYLTATIVFAPEEVKVEYTVSSLGDMVISLYKDNKNKAEEINNTLKTLIADTKDQVKNLKDLINEKSLIDQNMILELKNDILKETSKINERLITLEEDIRKPFSKLNSQILKDSDYEFLKTSIGSDFKLELLYSASKDGDNQSAFHSKCGGIAPTLTLIQSYYGKRFGGYTTSKWNSSNVFVKEIGTNFIFSLNDKAKYLNNDSNSTIITGGTTYILAFGAGNDIYISNGCTTNQNSFSTPRSYNIPNNLAGGYKFTVEYIEIFKVV
jgi:hypothetical protein